MSTRVVVPLSDEGGRGTGAPRGIGGDDNLVNGKAGVVEPEVQRVGGVSGPVLRGIQTHPQPGLASDHLVIGTVVTHPSNAYQAAVNPPPHLGPPSPSSSLHSGPDVVPSILRHREGVVQPGGAGRVEFGIGNGARTEVRVPRAGVHVGSPVVVAGGMHSPSSRIIVPVITPQRPVTAVRTAGHRLTMVVSNDVGEMLCLDHLPDIPTVRCPGGLAPALTESQIAGVGECPVGPIRVGGVLQAVSRRWPIGVLIASIADGVELHRARAVENNDHVYRADVFSLGVGGDGHGAEADELKEVHPDGLISGHANPGGRIAPLLFR